jgi:hypothetical protein
MPLLTHGWRCVAEQSAFDRELVRNFSHWCGLFRGPAAGRPGGDLYVAYNARHSSSRPATTRRPRKGPAAEVITV